MRTLLFILAVVVQLFVCGRARHLRGPLRAAWALAPCLLLITFASLDRIVMHKALSLFLMPAGLMWLSLLALAARSLASWSRRPARSRQRAAAVAVSGFAIFWLVASPVVPARIVSWLERGYERTPVPRETLDAVLLLGGGAARSAFGRAELTASGDRVATAAGLANQGHAQRIVCTGSDFANPAKAAQLTLDTASLLSAMGVAQERLVILAGPRNTSEEIVAARELFAREGWTRIGLVTSAWHMRRAMRLAARNGLDALAIPADHHGGRGYDVELFNAIPTTNALSNLHLAMWELLGALVGR